MLFFYLLPVVLHAQVAVPDSAGTPKDTAAIVKDSLPAKADSIVATKDSAVLLPVAAVKHDYNSIVEKALEQNRYINWAGQPLKSFVTERKIPDTGTYFYILLALVLLLAVLRFFYQRYFNNLFRVFFNTSLRQSQLTDQLLQAKQVSLLFNILFALTGGLYIYFVLGYFNWIKAENPFLMIGVCTVCLAVIYLFKFITLKFTGWLTGYQEAVNTYLFVIFLINKILGILLIPFVIIIAFGDKMLQYPAVLISSLVIGLMFLLRFLRSYGLLGRQVKVSRFHFFLYIAGVEIMPLLLIYKGVMVLLDKNL